MFIRKQTLIFKNVLKYSLRVARLNRRNGFGFSTLSSLADSGAPPKERSVPKTEIEFSNQRSLPPYEPSDAKLLKVAVLGQPNVGKSTLINKILNWKVFAVSKKVHTTRQNAKGIFVKDNVQIVFVDTPGVVDIKHGRKHNLEATMIVAPEYSLKEADAVCILVDASNHWTRDELDENIVKLLNMYKDKVSVLVLNKVDLLISKRKLLESIHKLTLGKVGGYQTSRENKNKKLTAEELFERAETGLNKRKQTDVSNEQHLVSSGGWPYFSRVFMISALNDDGIEDLRDFLLSLARKSPWLYNSAVVTDQHPHDIALTVVREKLLEYVPDEIPYMLKMNVEMWDIDPNGILKIVIRIKGSNSRQLTSTIGPKGDVIRKVALDARQELANIFRSDISLKLVLNTPGTKVKES